MRALWLAGAALSLGAAPPLAAQDTAAQDGKAVLSDPVAFAEMAKDGARYPLFAAELARTKAQVDGAMKAGIAVPVPKDPGGGATHEQHKRNYQTLYGAGLLYRITGNKAYADFSRAMLLDYAKLYPTLGEHPAKANESSGRLFWQSLNDSVWLVYAIQGYDAIRDTLSASDRKTIDDKVFRAMATFLSAGSPQVINRIHNHATWACAGVGMTGYVLRDRALVDVALMGLDKSGKAGFLRQVDELFSPDGYYNEGPYYQRYALQPFVVFAKAIADNDPGQRIFERRDGVLKKAIRTTIELTYDGYFFPLNDAMPDKSLKTDELYQAVSIGYAITGDPEYLAIADWQQRTTLKPEGLRVARDLAAGKAKPFIFPSRLYRDGPKGDQGGVAVLRSGESGSGGNGRATTLVAKNSAMGMGHGHFDKLNWLFYDNGHAVVTDYGAARFLNVESKDGGRYLPENDSWAKQTVAHNSLVVNETSAYDGKWRDGEKNPPKQLYFSGDGPVKISTAEMDGAWPGVRFRRSLALVPVAGQKSPLVVDLLKVTGDKPATYDLPLHYQGHITDTGLALQSNPTVRPVLGKANGYQHIWVDATAPVPDPSPPVPAPAEGAEKTSVTWILGGRFYTYRMLPPAGSQVILGESGANDPRFNLRREPLILQRVSGARKATFVTILEPHGAYDASAETTVGSRSAIAHISHARSKDADLITLHFIKGTATILAIADSVDEKTAHSATINGRKVSWKGHFATFDTGATP